MAWETSLIIGTIGIAFLLAYLATLIKHESMKILFFVLSIGAVLLSLQLLIEIATDITTASKANILSLLSVGLTIGIVIFFFTISFFFISYLINIIRTFKTSGESEVKQDEIE